MPKISLVAALVLGGGSLSAWGPVTQEPGGMGHGKRTGRAIAWKIGTVVATEYRTITGKWVLGQYLVPVL
jgi:beta-glucosidase-like glycosyl hydrolase